MFRYANWFFFTQNYFVPMAKKKSSAAGNTIHSFDYFENPNVGDQNVIVLFGDDSFLKREALKLLLQSLVDGESAELSSRRFDGANTQWRDIHDELATNSLFGGGQNIAVIDDGDVFVSEYRTQLEDHCSSERLRGVLILIVGSWPKNTRLFKKIDQIGLQIECKIPMAPRSTSKIDESRVRRWVISWAASQHQIALDESAAQQVLELNDAEFGMMDQSLAKLALYVSGKEKVTAELVAETIGGWRTKTTWDLVDAAAEGRTAEALTQLQRLLQAGEHPMALYGQISWSLRRYAKATEIIFDDQRKGKRVSISNALEKAGIRKWPKDELQKSELRIKQLGRDRAGKLYQWLLETDLALKGSHSKEGRARTALETLIFKMAKAPKA